jgi:hypothetical protein
VTEPIKDHVPQPPPAPEPLPEPRDATLRRPARSTALLVGVAAAVTGAVATFFHGANGAPATALIAVGAVFLYLGISGQRLTRLKIGDNEANLTRVIEDLVTDPGIPPEIKQEIATSVADRRAELPSPIGGYLDGLISAADRALWVYREALIEQLRATIADLAVSGEIPRQTQLITEPRGRTSHSRTMTMLLHFGNGRMALVHPALSARPPKATSDRPILTVGPEKWPSDALGWANVAAPRRFVTWASAEDNDELRVAIKDIYNDACRTR